MVPNLDDCGGATDFINEHAEEHILDDLEKFVDSHEDAIIEILKSRYEIKKRIDVLNSYLRNWNITPEEYAGIIELFERGKK